MISTNKKICQYLIFYVQKRFSTFKTIAILELVKLNLILQFSQIDRRNFNGWTNSYEPRGA